MESSQWENWNHLFCRKVSFLTAPHCQFRGVGQGSMYWNWLWCFARFPIDLKLAIIVKIIIHDKSIWLFLTFSFSSFQTDTKTYLAGIEMNAFFNQQMKETFPNTELWNNNNNYHSYMNVIFWVLSSAVTLLRGRMLVEFTTTCPINAVNSTPAQARCTRYNSMW